METTTQAQEICRIAEEWIGTPFKYGACRKGHGVDCAKLVLAVFKEAGVMDEGVYPPHQHKDWAAGKDVDPNVFRNELLKYGDPVPYDDRQPGDVITFRYRGIESHLGILVEDDCIVHAYIGKDVMKQRLSCFPNVCAVYRAKK